MESYLHLFETEQEFDAQYEGSGYTEPWVSYTMETSAVSFNKGPRDYSQNYLTFEILSAGTIVWKAQNTAYTASIEYSTDNGSTWSTITSNTGASAPSINVSAGDRVLFKGNNAAYSSGTSRNNCFSGSTASFNVNGNIMSLIYGANFKDQIEISSAYTFVGLFSNTKVIDSSNFVLPATTLALDCYGGMFAGCTSLTLAPVLPATTLEHTCYTNMFQGCTSLTIAPELPATTLADYCYSNMFQYCTGLTSAPELPASALAIDCYVSMFADCASLTQAPELPASALAIDCYSYMFQGCTSLTSAPELTATTLADYCYQDMFEGCTGLTSVPTILPATTLAWACYCDMFMNCTSLTSAPELPATTLVDECYQSMFNGCTSLAYIKCLATDITAPDCTMSWVGGISSTGTFVTPSSTQWETGDNGIPEGWTRVDA